MESAQGGVVAQGAEHDGGAAAVKSADEDEAVVLHGWVSFGAIVLELEGMVRDEKMTFNHEGIDS